MNRRNFFKKSAFTLGSLATISLLENPLMAYDINNINNHITEQNMKKIIIIDGGPRRNMNTAQMLQKFAEGAQSVGVIPIGKKICRRLLMPDVRWHIPE